MSISPPSIIGPLTPVSFGIRVSGVLVGGVVRALRNGQEIGGHAVVAPDMSFEFVPGTTLNAGDQITAVQEFDGQISASTPLPTVVQQIDPPFSGHRFTSHLFTCGRCLMISGVIAGAELRLQASGQPLGSARCVDGAVIIDLARGINKGEQVQAQQFVNGAPGSIVTSSPADPPPVIGPNRQPPLYFPPVLECQTPIEVKNLVDGETLLVYPDVDADPKSYIELHTPLPDWRLSLPGLRAHQKIKVIEQLCERGQDPDGIAVEVGELEFRSLPQIAGPLCPGTRRITVTNLVPNAAVTVKQGDIVVGYAQTSSDTLDMWVDPLVVGEVYAVEALCTKSCTGQPQVVVANPIPPHACTIRGPLFDCASQAWYTDATTGAWLACFSDRRGQLSDWQRADGPDGVLDLHTSLREDEYASIQQSVCGANPEPSTNSERVREIGHLPAPDILGPVYIDQPAVKVRGIPGALVELRTRQVYVGSATADWEGIATFTAKVTPTANLYAPSTYLSARQTLCDQVSGFGDAEEIKSRQPKAPIIIAPAIGETGVDPRPTFKWSDPAAGTKDAATSYFVFVTDASNPQLDTNKGSFVRTVVAGTQLKMPTNLPYSSAIYWMVQGVLGEPGFEVSGPPAKAHFTTMAQFAGPEPGQPAKPPSGATGSARVLIYNCHTDHRTITIYVRDATANGDFKQIAALNHQYDEWGQCPVLGESTPTTVTLTDGHTHEIVAVDVGGPNCTDGKPTTLGCRRFSLVVVGDKNGGDYPVVVS
ncbi:hypothetical protein [Mycobacterium sp. SMC-19]|uniref:hypothetical protein n=1 Tax=Mycobacterium sp. SMC-19 TaxID=3381630 RepID=UPI003876265E